VDPERLLLILAILVVIIISAGCVGENKGKEGIPPVNESPTISTGIIRTPETTSLPDLRVLPLITPNETNAHAVNVTPAPQVMTYLFSLEEAPQLTTQPLYVPTYLPEQWRYTGGSISSEGIITLQISGFLIPILYIQAPAWSDVGGRLSGPDVKYHPVYANDITYLCSEADMVHQLFWTDDAYDYYLIGGQNCSELLIMAGSVKPLDYEILDQLPHTLADPANPYPNPERIRLIFPVSWIRSHDPDKYPHRMIDIIMSSEEFNSSFSPDPRYPYMLRHKDVKEDEDVAYLSLPKELFDSFSVGPEQVRIRYPDNYFVYFTDLESLYEFPWKDPIQPGWKPAKPVVFGTITPPATPLLPMR
jgi:hypothetical protein